MKDIPATLLNQRVRTSDWWCFFLHPCREWYTDIPILPQILLACLVLKSGEAIAISPGFEIQHQKPPTVTCRFAWPLKSDCFHRDKNIHSSQFYEILESIRRNHAKPPRFFPVSFLRRSGNPFFLWGLAFDKGQATGPFECLGLLIKIHTHKQADTPDISEVSLFFFVYHHFSRQNTDFGAPMDEIGRLRNHQVWSRQVRCETLPRWGGRGWHNEWMAGWLDGSCHFVVVKHTLEASQFFQLKTSNIRFHSQVGKTGRFWKIL